MTFVAERCVTGHAGNQPGNGPFLDMTLHVVGTTVREASYETYQCPGCHACGKAICEMVLGKDVEEAGTIQHDALVSRVGPLPRHRAICYGLALLALDDALRRLNRA